MSHVKEGMFDMHFSSSCAHDLSPRPLKLVAGLRCLMTSLLLNLITFAHAPRIFVIQALRHPCAQIIATTSSIEFEYCASISTLVHASSRVAALV